MAHELTSLPDLANLADTKDPAAYHALCESEDHFSVAELRERLIAIIDGRSVFQHRAACLVSFEERKQKLRDELHRQYQEALIPISEYDDKRSQIDMAHTLLDIEILENLILP